MYKNEFRDHACFLLLVLSVKIQIVIHIIFQIVRNSIIAEYTQLRRVGTAANYKVLHNHISAQLLLSKHRHSKKPTGAKSQPVTSQGYLQSKDIDRIISIYSFRDLLAGTKFKTISLWYQLQQNPSIIKGNKYCPSKYSYQFKFYVIVIYRIH